MKRFIALVIFGCLLLSAASCASANPNTGNTYITGSPRVFVYRDSLCYVNGGTILCQSLDAVAEHGISIDNDPMASASDRPFGSITSAFFFCEDAKTGDLPRMVLAYTGLQNQTPRIAEYDLNTGSFSVLVNDIEDTILSLYGYGKYLFYTTNAGDKGYEIFRVDRKSGKTVKMENLDAELRRIACFAGDRMFYYTETGSLYSCALDFSDQTYLREFAVSGIVPSVSDGYLYLSTESTVIPFGQSTLVTKNLVRAQLDDLSRSETVSDSIYVGWGQRGSIFYMPVDPVLTDAGKTDYANNTLYRVGAGGNNDVVFRGEPDAESVWYLAFSDEYAVRMAGMTEYLVVRLATGESFRVPK